MTDEKTQDNVIICVDGEERTGMSSVNLTIQEYVKKALLAEVGK